MAERTAELAAEKQKTEDLVCRMLHLLYTYVCGNSMCILHGLFSLPSPVLHSWQYVLHL